MARDEAALKSWQRHFDATFYVGNPCLPPISTMQEVEYKLVAAINAVESFADENEASQPMGLEVARLAIDFGCKVLVQLGVLDDEGQTPPPLNLKMAKSGLLNLVETIHQQIGEHRIAMKLQAEEEDYEIDSIDLAIADEEAKAETKPVFDSSTFSVEWHGKSLNLGSTLAYYLFERLCRSPGIYISIDTLMQDVWKGKSVSDEAVQKQVSNLRKKLSEAGFEGVSFDGDQPMHYRLILR